MGVGNTLRVALSVPLSPENRWLRLLAAVPVQPMSSLLIR
jgi:hypothetical protein